MRKIFHILTLLSASVLLFSCGETKEIPEPMAVIEGTISDGAYPTLLFSSSIVPAKEGSLRDALVNWGKVTISDGEREVVMTGSPDDRYLPPFRYQTLDMTGEPGKTYTVTASFMDLQARATCRLPFPTQIDSLLLVPTDVDTLRAATLYFTSPDETPAYYYLTMRSGARQGRDAPCMMGTIKTDEPRRVYSIAALRPRVKIDSLPYNSQLIVGEEWTVSLNRVERDVYEFWKAYDNMIIFSSSPFLNSSESLPGNVEGGYGVWSPQGSSKVSFIVGRDSIVYGPGAQPSPGKLRWNQE